ncbi:MAG: hypothetical protein ACI4LB_08595 [Candidatus Fimenecus sp.]
MKKALSIALALTMLFALCVPAFAAGTVDITADGGTGDSIVKTLTTLPGGGSAENFTVSIPAETEIPWLTTTAYDIAYTVESHLAYGKHLEVSVADKDAQNIMTYAPEAGVTLELPYTLSDTTYTAAGPVVNPPTDSATNAAAKITVAESDWNNAIIGEYADTLLFTVNVVTA